MVPKMVKANPSMVTYLSTIVSGDRATQDAGDAGCAHALMLSFEGVDGTPLDAFQRGLAPPAKIYEDVGSVIWCVQGPPRASVTPPPQAGPPPVARATQDPSDAGLLGR